MWLTFTSGGEEGVSVEATGERFVIGRDDGCDLVIPDERASRRHAYLRALDDGRAELHDLDSANGTFVNGHRIDGPVLLTGGEQLQFGNMTLATSRGEPGDLATTIGVQPAGIATAIEPQPAAPAAPSTPSSGGAGRTPSPSTIERIKLRRSVRSATLLAAAAIVAAIVVVVLVVGGVFDGDESDEPNVPDIVAQVTPSTVIVFPMIDGEAAGNGTGWVLDADEGLIVTNAHVVNGGETFTVGVGESQRDARVVGVATCDDLALLQVSDRAGLVTLPLGDQSTLKPGQSVVALGFPGSASLKSNLTTTVGVVSVARTSFDLQAVDVPQYPNVIQTDAAINPGNSGGPLVNSDGELVGVNSAGITLLGERTIQGQGYAIGVDRVKEIVPVLREGRSLGWSGMGFNEFIIDPAAVSNQLSSAGLPLTTGLAVLTATEGTPAAEAGFGQSPVLVSAVNGQNLDGSLPNYCQALGGPEQARDAVFSVFQGGATQPQDVTVRFP